MAVNDNTKDNAPQTTVGEAFARSQQNAPRQESGQTVNKTFRNPSAFGPRLMGRNLKSDQVVKMQELLTGIYAVNVDPMYNVAVFGLDMENNMNLGISVVVVAVSEKAEARKAVAYHTLLLEGTIEPMASRFENINTGAGTINVEVPRFPGSQYNVRMDAVVKEELNKRFPNVRLISADAAVVPRDFKMDDKQLMNMLAANAVFAAGTVLEEANPNFQDLNLAQVARDSRLFLRPVFSNNVTENAVGAPIRSDIQLNLTSTAVGEQGTDGVERSTPVATISAFVDLVYAPLQPQMQLGFQAPQIPTQKYIPRIVITKLESESALTTGLQLLTLAQTAILRTPSAWMQTFLTKSGAGKGKDLRDPGMLNIEANVFNTGTSGFGEYIDTKATSFTNVHMGKFLSDVIRQDVMVMSQDISHCDPTSWLNSAFLASARGNQEATKRILRSADQLTNGFVSKNFNDSMIARVGDEIIHLGYYEDSNGVMRDLRDIDLLAVLNLEGEKDPNIARLWTETFLAKNVPEVIRLADRKRIISNLVTQAVFTGTATRIDYSTHFLDVLVAGCAAAGLDVQQNMPFQSLSGQERHTASFDTSVMMGAQQGPTFLRSGFQGGQANNSNASYSGYNRFG